jgi:hypothetical protein
MTRNWLLFVLAGIAAIPANSVAQVRPPGYRAPVVRPPVYYNPYYPPGTAYGNALSGAADLTRAQGNVPIQTQQAYIEREKANQAKIETKKMAFDQMLYEKANTPTYLETLTKERTAVLNRMMSYPTRAEISDGKTLNTMLPYLQSLSERGSMGAPVSIAQSKVSELNLAMPGSLSVGMLRNGGADLVWPPALVGPRQKKLNKLIPNAVNAASTGELDAAALKVVRTELTAMRDDIRKQYQHQEVETASYFRAIEFYDSLYSAVNALERPDAKKQLSGAYVPKAKNVQELVDFVTENGLQFAPASPGGENAYQVVHDMCVRYARTAQNSSGFQSSSTPVAFPGKK